MKGLGMNIKTGNQIYQHPDGHAIDLLNGMLTVTDADGQTASVPIGEIGLAELGERMVSIGQALTTGRGTAEQAGHELNTIGNPGNMAEQVGSGIAMDCLNAMLAADSQGERLGILQGAILDLAELPRHDRAAGGFAAILVNVLEQGLEASKC